MPGSQPRESDLMGLGCDLGIRILQNSWVMILLSWGWDPQLQLVLFLFPPVPGWSLFGVQLITLWATLWRVSSTWFSDFALVAWDLQWWEYLHHENLQSLHIRAQPSPLPPSPIPRPSQNWLLSNSEHFTDCSLIWGAFREEWWNSFGKGQGVHTKMPGDLQAACLPHWPTWTT